jgi:hypothetical protein
MLWNFKGFFKTPTVESVGDIVVSIAAFQNAYKFLSGLYSHLGL